MPAHGVEAQNPMPDIRRQAGNRAIEVISRGRIAQRLDLSQAAMGFGAAARPMADLGVADHGGWELQAEIGGQFVSRGEVPPH